MAEQKQASSPKPGDPSAKDKGCTCPVMDNHNGRGINGQFWINGDCPIHAPRPRAASGGE